MPIKPESPEKKPPVRKAKGTKMGCNPLNARVRRIKKVTAKKIATTEYCRLR
jgi:hypothetical protein